MNKMAVFVEGLTEQIFVEKLLVEIAGQKNIHIEKCGLYGGRKFSRKKIYLRHVVSNKEYFAYIINCHGDSTVKSDIVDNYDSLAANGYKSIIGVRDVYPIGRSEIPKLKRWLYYYVKTKPIVPILILSVMEIEAWFLAEFTHFQSVHRRITTDRIKHCFGYDPSVDNMELRDKPSQDLHEIYSLEGIVYDKKASHIAHTVNSLDYANIYLNLSKTIQPIGQLTSEINRFMES